MRASSQGVTVVALLSDPDAPTEIAKRLARALPARLADKSGQGQRFDVEVVSEPFTAGAEDPPTLMRRIMDRGSAENWDIVVALTDLPLHSQGRKLVANLTHARGFALLSLPSLGGLRLQTRARRAVEEAVLVLVGPQPPGSEVPPRSRLLLESVDGRLTPVHPGPVGNEESADLRYVVSGPRGYLRVFLGMVRANRPWRLVPGLSKALAAALATGAVETVNSTVWSLAESLGAPRLVMATVGSVAVMIGWLIVDAQLWHHSAQGSTGATSAPRARSSGCGRPRWPKAMAQDPRTAVDDVPLQAPRLLERQQWHGHELHHAYTLSRLRGLPSSPGRAVRSLRHFSGALPS
ncbi:hypothetical protein [Streptomyces niveus]|uniref:hypothetical protein n=1 Tax=Streptomyces niveus TaxID=193462 RepID=UPI0035DB52CD